MEDIDKKCFSAAGSLDQATNTRDNLLTTVSECRAEMAEEILRLVAQSLLRVAPDLECLLAERRIDRL